MPTDFWGNAIFSVVPTLVFGVLFFFVIRALFRADRGERRVQAQIEAEESARFEAERAAKRAAAGEPPLSREA